MIRGEGVLKRSSLFSSREIKILSALADALIPASEKIPERPGEVGVVESVQATLKSSHFTICWAFRVALFFLQVSAIFYRLNFHQFTSMSQPLQRDYLHWLKKRRLLFTRLLQRLLEVYVLTSYYASEKISSRIGYRMKLPNKVPSRDLYGEGLIFSTDRDIEEEVDVCVIGSGAGGAVMAKELAERGVRVVLIEEGGRFDLNDFKGDAIVRSRKMYRDAGIVTTLGFPPILLPLGKAIGGTTIINSGTCFRTPESVFKNWRENFGLKNFSSESMDRYFQSVESNIHVMPVPENLLGKSAEVIRRGMDRLGITGSPLLRNIKGCEGSGLCCFGCPTDGKQSVQLNYIPQALKAGAKLYAGCRVERIEKSNHQITSVIGQFAHPPHKKLKVRAKVFILSAGAVGSPALLLKNHLANRSHQVGKNLTLHPAAKALALFDEKIEGWVGTPQSYYSDFLKSEGVMFEGVFTPPSLGSTSLLVSGKYHKEVMENYDKIASFGFMIEDTARGKVRLVGGYPVITYSLHKKDVEKFIFGFAWLARLFFAAGAKAVFPSIHCLPELRSEADLDRLYQSNLKRADLEIAAFHPLGTARMGVDPKCSVVDEFGRSHDHSNLFVIDGSVFPTPLGVNPQVTIMAFAARAAEHIHQEIS